MFFCPVPWFSKPMEEEFDTIKREKQESTFETPLVEKAQRTILTPPTEALTPGENASASPIGEASSFASSSDSFDSVVESNADNSAPSPIKPQALAFEEPSMEKIAEEKEKILSEKEKIVQQKEMAVEKKEKPAANNSALKFVVLAIVFVLFSLMGNIFPQTTTTTISDVSVEPVVESKMSETSVDIEATSIDAESDAEIDIDANVEIEEAEAVE